MILSFEKENSLLRASGSMLRPNVWVPEVTGLVNSRERKIWQFYGQIMENSLIPDSGLSEAG
jgi:hypothetical protein